MGYHGGYHAKQNPEKYEQHACRTDEFTFEFFDNHLEGFKKAIPKIYEVMRRRGRRFSGLRPFIWHVRECSNKQGRTSFMGLNLRLVGGSG
jgi:hypothetical protein